MPKHYISQQALIKGILLHTHFLWQIHFFHEIWSIKNFDLSDRVKFCVKKIRLYCYTVDINSVCIEPKITYLCFTTGMFLKREGLL